ncbi:Glycerol-3-phosphate acyltransferase 3 [Thelohanellus kitauei]|uniref:Glycerol-3-phosphate acyltransferase 3 n=1 Tax=Thelohanellus kitauei TaxID=669202 RepID=A0A0C2I923_THEKT|nr:Glycerol-3-phosphate acyltransferase 3 [Thelohanellus kitauei]
MFAQRFNVTFCRWALGSMGVYSTFHDLHNLPTSGIVVSNHTSPIDVLVLGSINFYRFIGQIQPGYFSYLQRHLSHMGHIFFEREDHSDRVAVLDCLKQHAKSSDMPPVIIFPEGTCVNNTSVMQFRKGTFEICDIVHPVAIKYNPMFGDAFWDSSKMSYGWYILHIASCWFLYCDVWFLPPLIKQKDESAAAFACRVQKAIAEKANIINLDWDGNLKRSFVPAYLKINKQKEYAKSIIIDGNP